MEFIGSFHELHEIGVHFKSMSGWILLDKRL